MAESSPSSSPKQTTKTLIDESLSSSQSPMSSISNGKSKLEAKDEESCGDSCGICLSEAGNGVSRGCIDCCDHYFCFLCIMEWARVESKCPLCKRRFSTIRRPARPPVFASERVVQVPVRDQVYYHDVHSSIGPTDPYSEIRCSVCVSQEDECLLLLCDLCDSAAHTYCVGLGFTVPEGDWFCKECALLRDERVESESGQETEFRVRLSTEQSASSSAQEQVSIFSIVQDSPRSSPMDSLHLQLPGSVNDGIIEADIVVGSGSVSPRTVSQDRAKANTRTLQRCRNLNNRMCLMRQNWSAFQRGALHFSANAGDGDSSVRATRQSAASSMRRASSSALKSCDKDDEIEKAWKMMERAKAVKKGDEGSSIKHNNTGNGGNLCRRELLPELKNVAGTGSGNRYYHSFEKDIRKPFSTQCKWEVSMREPFRDPVGSSTVHSRAHLESSSLNSCARSVKNITESSSQVPLCSTPSFAPESIPLNRDDRGKRSDKGNNRSRDYDEAKNETRSLVKLYLTRRTKKEKLEVDTFKEIARLATHSVLAACGFEARRPGYCSIPASVCSHANSIPKLQNSSLMSNACRECFHTFVKEIVDAALSQKTGKL